MHKGKSMTLELKKNRSDILSLPHSNLVILGKLFNFSEVQCSLVY